MRSLALVALTACGQIATGSDANIADAHADACPFCFDTGLEELTPVPPPPIDAGVLDGSVVACGDAVCSAPTQYCCVQISPSADGGFDDSFACHGTSQPTVCGASIYCDDSTDCASGMDCCWDRYNESHSSCVPMGTCKCDEPNCSKRVMCQYDASTCACKPDPLVPSYNVCL